VRERFGGPGPQALAAAFASYHATLDAAERAATAIAAREASARHELESAFADLMGVA
jgi:argininosuccinate lyase